MTQPFSIIVSPWLQRRINSCFFYSSSGVSSASAYFLVLANLRLQLENDWPVGFQIKCKFHSDTFRVDSISDVTELILKFHGKREEETRRRGIKQNVTKLGKRLARRYPNTSHVFLGSQICVSIQNVPKANAWGLFSKYRHQVSKTTNTIVISICDSHLQQCTFMTRVHGTGPLSVMRRNQNIACTVFRFL